MNARRSGVLLLAAVIFLAACGGSAPATDNPAHAGLAVTVQPPSAEVAPQGDATFVASVTGAINTSVTWTVTESGGGTIDSTGHYVAPPGTGTFHVVAKSVADPSVSGSAVVTVTAAPVVAVSVSPSSTSVIASRSTTFSATVTGASDASVTWSVLESSGCGAVSSTGVYTAPASPATCHVVATSRADATKSASATVVVTAAPSPAMGLSPASLPFTATAGGSNPASKAITVSNTGSGTLAKPTASVSYASGSGWLTATVSGSAAPYTVTVQPSVAGLAAGSYAATVSLASAGASNTPRSASVTLTVAAAGGVWSPAASAPVAWNWNITQTGVAASTTVAMYDVDLFNESASWIATIKARGTKVICYYSAGTSETFRPDFASFPAAVKGSTNGWAGENWLDVRASSGALAIIQPIMAARLDLAVSKGCDGVEPDNVDGYDNSTGFPITAADQLVYNKWTADQAHARGLSVGLKNDVGQLADLVDWYDWALNEECGVYQECGGYSVFQAANKAVFHTEYTGNNPTLAQLQTRATTVCGWSASRRPAYFNTIVKGLDLPDLKVSCPYP